MEFKVYRDSWRSGKYGSHQVGEGLTLLMNDQKEMCCLGQVMKQCGISTVLLYKKAYPSVVFSGEALQDTPTATRFLLDQATAGYLKSSDFALDAARINDRTDLSVQRREELLISHFAKNGHSLTFVDGVAPWFQQSA